MATMELTLENFEDTISKDGITLVDFWAAWCGPCRMFGPIFEKAAEENLDIRFGKVDTEAQQQLAGMAGISSIPTLMIFRDGILLFNQAGALPAPALNDLIGKVKELNMDEVRADIAKQESSEN
jgi:thioredoxin 1